MPIENWIFFWSWIVLFVATLSLGSAIENNGSKYNGGVTAVFAILYVVVGWLPAHLLTWLIIWLFNVKTGLGWE